MLRRYDVVRSGLALFAALFAVIGAYSAAADPGHVARYPVALFFAVEALVAVTFAVWPSGGPWSWRRRALAFTAALTPAGRPRVPGA